MISSKKKPPGRAAGGVDSEDEKLARAIQKMEREIGPNFDNMSQHQLLKIAASNAFYSGKAIREIRIAVTLLTAITVLVTLKVFGVI
jgi:hypothetical protein